jgi:2-oxoglutarate dehydrogenase E1 component
MRDNATGLAAILVRATLERRGRCRSGLSLRALPVAAGIRYPLPPDSARTRGMDFPLPTSLNLPFLEGLYADFLRDPNSVSAEWRRYFEGLDGPRPTRLGPSFEPSSIFDPPPMGGGRDGRDGSPLRARGGNGRAPSALERRDAEIAQLQDRVDQLIRAYRVRGHLEAKLDPLGFPRPHQVELDPAFYRFTEADLERQVSTTSLAGATVRTLRDLLQRLRNTYCRSIGVQFMHIDDLAVKRWLQERMEATENHLALEKRTQLRILTKLTDATIFEEFIQKKFLGAKSFSLEGSESLIPLLDLAIEKASAQGVDEIVLAMAHRGRLNVLANILGKHPRQIFREFEDTDPELHMGRGDVKYHLGFSNDVATQAGRKMHLSLCFNPSHLEFVNPVALGRVRAKQDRYGDAGGRRGMALLIHGDAAFIGEGVTQETLNLSELPAYRTGGTIHVVVNNQIGFTTSPAEARSSSYCTDVAKMLQIPIFHVNGEDPEAVAQVVELALDFRALYQRDVILDMYGYRRRGHNEGDEPSFTQPLLYQAIARRPPVRDAYLEHLLELGGVSRAEADEISAQRREHLERELSAARSDAYVHPPDSLGGAWHGLVGGAESRAPDVETGVNQRKLAETLEALARVPDGFHLHPKLERGFAARREMAAGRRPLDWSAAEALAFGSVALEGHRVRLSGQDSQRGTFSQRHAVLHDVNDGGTYTPLQNLSKGQAPVEIWNSPLSEIGVLGFDYGYTLDAPESLVLWEAQFGDFFNVAQVIVDQFIVSAEDKWRRLSGIVLLLPHGFEGQGPEHSSARPERFLRQAADDNIQIVNPTTPANYFHALRRQVVRPWRKPLVVMTPKSLLRHPRCVSPLADLAAGSFRRFLPDARALDPRGVKRVLACSGKIYYELEERREAEKRDDLALVRFEQLYPLREAELQALLAPYPDGTPLVWVQEEPDNMGAWRFLRVRLGGRVFGRHPFRCFSRRASASPATGSLSSHKLEQTEILNQAFDLEA